MDLVTVLIGVAMIAYGLYAAWARTAKPEAFRKLEPMKQRFGERAGVLIHVLGYTVFPIVFGILLIVRGIQGGSLFK